jgi:hypothetical protein
LEGVVDTYQPGTLPPRLYQSIANQFSKPQDDEDLGGNVHKLVGHEVPATTEEMRQMEEEEAEGEAFSQAIENRTRAGRARKPTQKALEQAWTNTHWFQYSFCETETLPLSGFIETKLRFSFMRFIGFILVVV